MASHIWLAVVVALLACGCAAQDFPAPRLVSIDPAEAAVIWEEFEQPGKKVNYELQVRESAAANWTTLLTTLDSYGHFSLEPAQTLDFRVLAVVHDEVGLDLSPTVLVSGVATHTTPSQLSTTSPLWEAPRVQAIRTDVVLVEFFGVPGIPFESNATYAVEKRTDTGPFEVAAVLGADLSDRYDVVLSRIPPGERMRYRVVYHEEMPIVPIVSPEVSLRTDVFPSFSSVSMTQETLTAIEDAYVSELEPTRNFGSAPTLRAGRSKLAGDRFAFVKFDMTVLPANTRLVSATLRIAFPDPLPFQVRAYLDLDRDWSEPQVTFSSRPHPTDFSLWHGEAIPTEVFTEIPLDVLPNEAVDLINVWRSSPLLNFGVMIDILTFDDVHPYVEMGTRESLLSPALLIVELEEVTPTPTPTPLPTTTASVVPTASVLPSGTPAPSGTILPPPAPTPTPSTVAPTPTPTPSSGGNLTPSMTPQPTTIPTGLTPSPTPLSEPTATPVPDGGTVVLVDDTGAEVTVELVGAPDQTLLAQLVAPTPTIGITFGSQVLSVRLVDSAGGELQPRGQVEICFDRRGVPDSERACLGFFNERTDPPEWQCEDECLDEEGDSVCGKTDHFTNFAILLTGSRGEGCVAEDEALIFDELWQDILLVVLVTGLVVVIAVAVALVGAFVPQVRSLLYGSEGERVRSLREHNNRMSMREVSTSLDPDDDL